MRPTWMECPFEGLDNDPETRRLGAATAAAERCRLLHDESVDSFHFYSLHRADLSFAISHILGIRSTEIAP